MKYLILLLPLFIQARSIDFQDEYSESRLQVRRAERIVELERQKQHLLMDLMDRQRRLRREYRDYKERRNELYYLFEEEVNSEGF